MLGKRKKETCHHKKALNLSSFEKQKEYVFYLSKTPTER
jgi:hypothetical protein